MNGKNMNNIKTIIDKIEPLINNDFSYEEIKELGSYTLKKAKEKRDIWFERKYKRLIFLKRELYIKDKYTRSVNLCDLLGRINKKSFNYGNDILIEENKLEKEFVQLKQELEKEIEYLNNNNQKEKADRYLEAITIPEKAKKQKGNNAYIISKKKKTKLSICFISIVFVVISVLMYINKNMCEIKGHVLSDWIVKEEATCTECGLRYIQCTRCKEVIKSVKIYPLGHDYSDWNLSKEVTCTTDGEQYKACSRCSKKVIETISRSGHQYVNSVCTICGNINCMGKHISSDWIVSKEATCTSTGSRYIECSACFEIIKRETIQKKDHKYGNWTIDSDSTCSVTGSKHRICSVFGNKETGKVELKSHNYQNGKCLVCGFLQCSGKHNVGDWIITQDATCTETGQREKRCTICNETLQKESIAKIAHNSSDWVVTKEATCSTTGEKKIECIACHETLEVEEIQKENHTFGNWIIDTDSTCSITGINHRLCLICGYKETGTIVLKEHNYQNGKCTVCSAAQCNGKHTYSDWIVTEEATCQKTGTRIKRCTVCYDTLQSESIAMIAHNYQKGKCLVCDSQYESKGLSVSNGVLNGIGTCKDKEIYIPNNVTSIGDDAFRGCRALTSITIPNSVTSIGDFAFFYCTSLTSINIPNSVTSIGDSAFGDTDLTSITIPSSVTSIGCGIFEKCTSLSSIKVDSSNKKYDSRDNCNAIIETSSNKLISGCFNTIIPNSVTTIGDSAFFGCSNLKSITIPNSVTSIEIYAFGNCTGLTSINIPNSVTSIGHSAFYGCTGLTSITIPSSVTIIENGTFGRCEGLKNILIPNSVTSIGTNAFCGCTGLTSITIPNRVKYIAGDAFDYCTGLTSIKVDSGNMKYDSRNNCNAIIEKSTNKLIHGCNNTIIPDDIKSIGSCAFRECTGLINIVIPWSVRSIESYAFSGCTGLSSLEITENVKEIGRCAFQNISCDITYKGESKDFLEIDFGYKWSEDFNHSIICTDKVYYYGTSK